MGARCGVRSGRRWWCGGGRGEEAERGGGSRPGSWPRAAGRCDPPPARRGLAGRGGAGSRPAQRWRRSVPTARERWRRRACGRRGALRRGGGGDEGSVQGARRGEGSPRRLDSFPLPTGGMAGRALLRRIRLLERVVCGPAGTRLRAGAAWALHGTARDALRSAGSGRDSARGLAGAGCGPDSEPGDYGPERRSRRRLIWQTCHKLRESCPDLHSED
jgi:hypothetical protein